MQMMWLSLLEETFCPCLKEHMDDALRIIQNCYRIEDLTVNPSKTAMIFIRKYKPEAIESLKL